MEEGVVNEVPDDTDLKQNEVTQENVLAKC